MLSLRTAGAVLLLSLFNFKLTTCRSPGEGGSEAQPARAEVRDVVLPGVDATSLTGREKAEWSRMVSELLAPCPDQPVSIAQCVQESRNCKACTPAAKYLVRQVQRGRPRSQIELSYKNRFAPDQIKNVPLGDSPAKGNTAAPVVIVEFADFECASCKMARPVLDELLKSHDGQVRLVFKHFPLSMHQHAEKAARAAVAAQRQGKFWEMHGALFDSQPKLDEASVDKLAKDIGLDTARFLKDRDSEATADAVARDRKLGEELAIQGTPSLFINGRSFPSTPDFEADLQEWVTLEIELQGGSPAPSRPPPAPSALPPPSVPSAASAPASAGAAQPSTPPATEKVPAKKASP
jgi:protein-disulfide isomerase